MHGRTLSLRYRLADPDEARRFVPAGIEMDDDPIVRARIWDMEHDGCTPPGEPTRWTRFREAVIAFPVRVAGMEGDYPTYMYADEFAYTAMGREVLGWPVRDAQLEVDPEPDTGLAAGTTITGRAWRIGQEIMRIDLVLDGHVDVITDDAPGRWINTRIIPDTGDSGRAELAQLVWSGPRRIERREVWRASGTLTLPETATEELHWLAPREIVQAEYWAAQRMTVDRGAVITDLGDDPWTATDA
jgi:acetoacetate decarboxylase